HNVEQTFSLNDVDHTLLKGVPNTAFTEALAFVFQGRDLQLLGLPAPDTRSEAEKTLNDFWTTYEIAGVGLVDTAVWHWMYDHAQATPSQLNAATLQIAKDIWNRYYAPVFHQKDVVLLAVYSHMIDSFLYLPDYSIGHLIAAQIEEQMKKAGAIGPEFERIAKMGDVTPDLWMENGEFDVPSRLGSDLSRPLQFRERRFFRNVVDFTDSSIRACCQGNRCSDVFDVTSRRTPCRHFVEQQNSRAPVHHSFEHGKE